MHNIIIEHAKIKLNGGVNNYCGPQSIKFCGYNQFQFLENLPAKVISRRWGTSVGISQHQNQNIKKRN